MNIMLVINQLQYIALFNIKHVNNINKYDITINK